MKKKEIFQKIGSIISELTEQYQYLSEDAEHINDLELELFKANSHFLTDHIEILRKLNSSQGVQRPQYEAKATPAAAATNNPPETVSKIADSPRVEDAAESSAEVTTPAEWKAVSGVPVEDHVPSPERQPDKFELFDFESQPIENLYDRKLSDDEQAVINRKANAENLGEAGLPAPASPAIADPGLHEVVAPAKAEEAVIKEVVIPERIVQVDSAVVVGTNDQNVNSPSPKPVVDVPAASSAQPVRPSYPEVIPEPVQVRSVGGNEIPVSRDADHARESVPTVNDLISSGRQVNTLANNLNKQPIRDLKAIISLNDKLLFVRDLFNGYSLAYSEVVETLNRFDSLETADSFLKKNYAEKNNWSSKQSTVDKLYALLERKYSPQG